MDDNTVATVVVAVATSLTAVATLVAAGIGWASWRQQRADRQPIVELRPRWETDGSLTVRITVRNRLQESIVVEKVSVLRPRPALLTQERVLSTSGEPVGFAPATATELSPDRNVAPIGTRPATFDGGFQHAGTAADETITVNVQFPRGWSGGLLKLGLRVASASDHRRGWWLRRKRRVPARDAG